MKALSSLLTSALISLAASAGEPADNKAPARDEALFPEAIPKHIRYSKPDEAEARTARLALVKEFQNGEDSDIGKKPMIICHRTWGKIRDLKRIDPELGIKMTGIMPDGTPTEGRGYREAREIGIVLKFLRERLRGEKDTTIRTPTKDEITTYWAFISWDLDDSSLFVVERGDHRFLTVFRNDDLFHVFDLSSKEENKPPTHKETDPAKN